MSRVDSGLNGALSTAIHQKDRKRPISRGDKLSAIANLGVGNGADVCRVGTFLSSLVSAIYDSTIVEKYQICRLILIFGKGNLLYIIDIHQTSPIRDNMIFIFTKNTHLVSAVVKYY